MGCYDDIMVPCPRCGKKQPFQSKGGECAMLTYELNNCPADVLSDVNRHSPYSCDCGAIYEVYVKSMAYPVLIGFEEKKNESDK